jgi:hypothetical protein
MSLCEEIPTPCSDEEETKEAQLEVELIFLKDISDTSIFKWLIWAQI